MSCVEASTDYHSAMSTVCPGWRLVQITTLPLGTDYHSGLHTEYPGWRLVQITTLVYILSIFRGDWYRLPLWLAYQILWVETGSGYLSGLPTKYPGWRLVQITTYIPKSNNAYVISTTSRPSSKVMGMNSSNYLCDGWPHSFLGKSLC